MAWHTIHEQRFSRQSSEKCMRKSEKTSSIILHSDLGIQYTGGLFESYLCSKGIIHSFSRKGNPL
jgi:transposase InsO family protein